MIDFNNPKAFAEKVRAINERVDEMHPLKNKAEVFDSYNEIPMQQTDYSFSPDPIISENHSTEPIINYTGGSKLPKSIQESFNTNPGIDYNGSPFGGGISVLSDKVMNQPFNRAKEIINRGNLSESTRKEQEISQTPLSNQIIDYSTINALIKSAMNELKNEIISEIKKDSGNMSAVRLSGNSIQFITNKGDIYEGKLKHIGNLNS